MLIAGDIGGTKTDLAIFSNEAGPHSPLEQTKIHSADYPSLQTMVKEFLAKAKRPVDRACFAVAGPVINGRVKTTNLPWVIEELSLAQELNLNRNSVHLINDLQAIARAIPILRPSDLTTINAGEAVPGGAIAVIAPGTGLGESFLTWDRSTYLAHSSEGGHSDFAPTDARQGRLLEYMFTLFDHVSFEHVCSGIGIPHLYKYLRDVEHVPEIPELAKRIDSEKDPSFAIINLGIDPASPSALCRATLDLFLSILAGEAGDLALKFLATGGVYLAGGCRCAYAATAERTGFFSAFQKQRAFCGTDGPHPAPRCGDTGWINGRRGLWAREFHPGFRNSVRAEVGSP